MAALILDRSGSMTKNLDGSKSNKLEKAKLAAEAFVLAMRDSDYISISSFSDAGSTEQIAEESRIVKCQVPIDHRFSF